MRLYSYLLIFACVAIISSFQQLRASGQCDAPNLSPVEVEKCLSSLKEAKGNEPERKPATFPVRFHGVTRDPISMQESGIDWYSSDGTQLEISTPRVCGALGCGAIGKDLKKISKDRIISFDQLIAGKTTNASEQIQSVAVSAFILPIAAPFMAAINAKSIEIYQWTVYFIDDEGQEAKEVFITSSTVPVADRYYTFLSTLTGLKPGEKRSISVLQKYYEAGADLLLTKVRKDESLLVKRDEKKPWCSKTQFKELPLIYERYEQYRKKLNQVRAKLGVSEYQAVAEGSEESLWQQHLKSNPNFAVWAKANPKPTEKIKNCHSL